MSRTFALLVWAGFLTVILVPLILAASSPLLAWRQPIYIVAGFAGIIAMSLLLIQPLLAGRYLPGLSNLQARKIHLITGIILLLAVIVHVGALWITSPPDVIDALLLRSPTPFSVWGVIAMWTVFATAVLAVLYKKARLRPKTWRLAHKSLAVIIITGSVIHALLIEGTMEVISKTLLCLAVIIVTAKLLYGQRKSGKPIKQKQI